MLGTTSKLLTESITERVTHRTKDAVKQKIDRIHKSSRDRIAETTKSATNKLKSVRRNIHDTIEMTQNLSLGRKKNNSTVIIPEQTNTMNFSPDRPQTAPSNDELFSSISFNSPLNSKTNKCMNINLAESLYQIPKSNRSISSDTSAQNEVAAAAVAEELREPPTYEEAMKEAQRPHPTARNRKKNKVNSNVYENHELFAKATNDVETVKATNVDASDNNNDDLPCPNFPAPILTESIYGKLRASLQDTIDGNEASTSSQAEIRSKPRQNDSKNPETVKMADSNRATADSNEFASSEGHSKLESGLSEELNAKLKLQEENIPKADRSDSWSFYDAESDGYSSPEPIYENQQCSSKQLKGAISEPTYGVLYNTDSSDSMLTPVAIARRRRSHERNSCQYAKVNKNPEAKLQKNNLEKDILKEFDPLDRKILDKILTGKSNELILLEDILAAETYGNFAEFKNYEYNSSETSENEEIAGIPTPPERLDSLKEYDNEDSLDICQRTKTDEQNNLSGEQKNSIIIHQNSKLRSDSTENIFGEMSIESSSSKAQKTPETTGKTSNTRWFLGSSTKSDSKTKSKSEKKSSNSKKSNETPQNEQNDAVTDEKVMIPLTKTSSVKSIFSNVMHKVEGIKRKTSFRMNSTKNDVETVLEMIPRPCLTQRLIMHEGHLIRLPTGVVEDILKKLHARKAYIRDKKFQAYFDKDIKIPKENIPLETITTIQCVNNHKFSDNFVDIYCFEITTATPKNSENHLLNPNMVITTNNSGNTKTQRACHLYGVAKESERFIWMQKLLESLTDVFPPGFSCRFYRAGWCYSKVKIISCIKCNIYRTDEWGFN